MISKGATMQAKDFLLCFDRLIDHEGGFQKNPDDRGNWTSGKVGVGGLKGTKFGISAMSYPRLDIENLTLDDAKGIYWQDFWLRMRCPEFHLAIGYQLFDIAVNSGPGNSIRMLQRAVEVADDGSVGPITREAVISMDVDDVLCLINAERLEFCSKLSTWNIFGRGWARRIAKNLRLGAQDTPDRVG
jgi:lysozyme family protein